MKKIIEYSIVIALIAGIVSLFIFDIRFEVESSISFYKIIKFYLLLGITSLLLLHIGINGFYIFLVLELFSFPILIYNLLLTKSFILIILVLIIKLISFFLLFLLSFYTFKCTKNFHMYFFKNYSKRNYIIYLKKIIVVFGILLLVTLPTILI